MLWEVGRKEKRLEVSLDLKVRNERWAVFRLSWRTIMKLPLWILQYGRLGEGSVLNESADVV